MSYRNQPQDVDSRPSHGGSLPAGKDPANCDDAFGKPPKQNQTSFDAKPVDGAARKAIDTQVGVNGNPKRR